MVFLNWKELPYFWYGFNHLSLCGFLMIVLVPGVLAFRFRLVRVPPRASPACYLSIITQGADLCPAARVFFRNDFGFGRQ